MAKEKHPFDALRQYLPDRSFEMVMPLIHHYKVHLTITRERLTKLGDYRNAHSGKNHRISVNGNLNRYSFLITLLHELAHLLTFDKYRNSVDPHGREWKDTYAQVLIPFIQQDIFPVDIKEELLRSLHDPGASSCSEEGLQRILKRYDPAKEGVLTVEELVTGSVFKIANGRTFQKGNKVRKRFKCLELSTGKVYLFAALFEVMEVRHD